MSFHSTLERATGLSLGTAECNTGIGPTWCTTDTGRKVGVGVAGFGRMAYLFRVTPTHQLESTVQRTNTELLVALKGVRDELAAANKREERHEYELAMARIDRHKRSMRVRLHSYWLRLRRLVGMPRRSTPLPTQ